MRFAFDRSAVQTGLALFAILCLAAQVRLMGTGWDGFAALHPDERHLLFLTQEMLAALADPAEAWRSAGDWWFNETSPLNPHLGARLYVYGEAPLLAGVLAAHVSGPGDWFEVMALTRRMAALVDTVTVGLVFCGARLIAGNAAALAAAVLYAAMPLALQLANFHTVDVWLTAGCAGALVPMIALAQGRDRPLALAALAGALAGLALACKITAALLVLPGLVALALAMRRGLGGRAALGALVLAVALCLLGFRLANPFAFSGPGLLGLQISGHWTGDLAALGAFASPDLPPNWQWMAGYSTADLMRDFVLFGAGPVASVLLVVALLRGARRADLLVPLAAVLAFVALTALSSASALRYAAPALAPLAMALAPALRTRVGWAVPLALLGALWWGAGAVRLHDGQHPRLAASHWLWSLPRGTVLTNETAWDESLPTLIRPAPDAPFRWPSQDGWFTFKSLEITDPDSPDKIRRMADLLARTDYLILSSERHSAVMPRLPERFPATTAHYRRLLAGDACFAPVLEIDRGYPLPWMRLADAWAQEPWRIYDHPVVRIFRRLPCFDADTYAAGLAGHLPEG
ncbi:MAG: hypothetical protein EP318_02790 [Rhodobacteraceae bacterium]|nr:MAG: hypothetical protein EP318_02790 [Paracoccaceae bacterium]